MLWTAEATVPGLKSDTPLSPTLILSTIVNSVGNLRVEGAKNKKLKTHRLVIIITFFHRCGAAHILAAPASGSKFLAAPALALAKKMFKTVI